MQEIDYTQSCLSPKESEGIKGIIMLLIILGHNIAFVKMTDDVMAMIWLYCFHIHQFFILPYFYPIKPLTWSRIGKHITRFYTPFLILGIPLLCISLFFGHCNAPLWKFPLVFIGGGSLFLQSYIGVQVLWFLPAMCIATFIRESFLASPSLLKSFFIILAIFAILFPFIGINNDKIYSIFCYFISGFQYLAIGLFLRRFCQYGQKIFKFAVVIFVLCSISFFINYLYLIKPIYHGYHFTTVHRFISLLLTFSFCIIIYHNRFYLSKIKWLTYIGRNSMLIYLSHAFIGFMVYWLLNYFTVPLLIQFPISLTLVMLGSIGVVVFFNKYQRLKHLFIPNSFHQLKNEILALFNRQTN